jgi:hypothetical protein
MLERPGYPGIRRTVLAKPGEGHLATSRQASAAQQGFSNAPRISRRVNPSPFHRGGIVSLEKRHQLQNELDDR